MWAARYFNPQYWVTRYWAKGAAATALFDTPEERVCRVVTTLRVCTVLGGSRICVVNGDNREMIA